MRVCIIGSGLSTLTLAKALVNQNIFVDILSSSNNYKIDESRTIGISKSNLDFFNENVLNIDKIAWKLKKIEIYTENLKNEKILNFENKKSQLFSILKNYELYKILNKSLSKNKFCKKIKFKKKLINFNKYNLVINCDHSNYITKKYFNKKIIKTYNSFAFTSIIEHGKIQNDTAIQIFTRRGPLAFLPLSKYKTSIVYSFNNYRGKTKIDFNNLINQYNFKYKIEKIHKPEKFQLKSIILRKYHNNKILAFGDILHRIHPLAGQGFNMTIRDVNIFLDIVKKKIDLGLPLDSLVNSEFEKTLRHKNYIFSNSIDLIHEFFNLERKLNNDILSKSIKLLGKNTFINKMFTRIADKGLNF
tara:strand:+ start:192 stop:1268 length:1077 start_codon:yes stop_codon:yes gene_type:complete